MPASPLGWNYYRNLTDGNATALSNHATKVLLTSSNFDFTKCRSDGTDLRVWDATAGALVPHYLVSFDATAQAAELWYKATATGNAHQVYFGNPEAADVSSFATTFTKGTGFDSNWGDLTTATSGTNPQADRVAAATGWADARYRRAFRRSKTPGIAGTTNSGDLGVRDLWVVTNPDGTVATDGSGNWVGYYGSQPSSTGIRRTFRALSADGGVTWTGHTLALSPGATEDASGAIPGCVIKISGSSYYMFYTGTPGGVCLATASDIMGPWTKQGVVVSSTTTAIVDYTCASVAVPRVRRMSDGTWTMVCESRPSGGAWRIVGFTATSEAGPWTVMNSGHVLLAGNANWWGTDGYANPVLDELAPGGPYLLFLNGHVGHTGTPEWPSYNFQSGFYTNASTYNTGTWTQDASSPPFGRKLSFYGVETSAFFIGSDGERVLFVQDYASFSSNQPYGDIYRAWPIAHRGGQIETFVTTEAAVAGCVLASGNFTAETRSYMTAHRCEDSSQYTLAIVDASTLPAPNTSTALGSIFRLAIRRTTFGNASPGDFQLLYWDASSVVRYWNGSTWTTTVSTAATSDTNREVLSRVADDGTNFVLTVRYADDDTLVVTASIAKSSVKTFTAARFILIGDPFTNAFAGGTFFRSAVVRPYAATEPSMSLGSQSVVFGPPIPAHVPLTPAYHPAFAE